MTEIYWLVEFCDSWKILTSEELKEYIDKEMVGVQIWRLIHGRQPESRYITYSGTINDIFGNTEVL